MCRCVHGCGACVWTILHASEICRWWVRVNWTHNHHIRSQHSPWLQQHTTVTIAMPLLVCRMSFNMPFCLPLCLPTYLPTYQLTNLPTYQPTNLPTYQLTNLPTCQPTNLPTYPHTCLPTYMYNCLSTCLFICLPTCLPACLPVYLHACLPVCMHACTHVDDCLYWWCMSNCNSELNMGNAVLIIFIPRLIL